MGDGDARADDEPAPHADEFPVRGDAPGVARVRRYDPADEASVVALHERAMRDAGTDPADVPGIADLRWIEAAYLETGGEFLVVDVPESGDDGPGDVVAMGGLVVDGTVGELLRFAVDPDYQRGGLGRALLVALERSARDRGVERLTLTTASRQDAAVGFYAAHGYEEVERESRGDYELVRYAKGLS